MAPRLTRTLDAGWEGVPVLRVGPSRAATPIAHALADGPGGRVRVDVHAAGADCYAFEDVVEWRGSLAIGIGSFVHLVGLADGRRTTIPLGAYFSCLQARADCLLVASAERVLRVEPDHSVLWRSEPVGLDGVVLQEDEPGPVLRGDGEWDPPGGWRPFALSVQTGAAILCGTP